MSECGCDVCTGNVDFEEEICENCNEYESVCNCTFCSHCERHEDDCYCDFCDYCCEHVDECECAICDRCWKREDDDCECEAEEAV